MYQEYVKQALSAAKYHEGLAFKYAHPTIKQYDRVLYHLRAYFWEIWSVWDYILQQANSNTLNLDPINIRRDFLKKLEEKYKGYKYLQDLKDIESDGRLTRIRLLRDYAHKWFIDPYQIEYDGNVVNVICIYNPEEKDKNLQKQINIDRNDLSFIENIVNTLVYKGFFSQ